MEHDHFWRTNIHLWHYMCGLEFVHTFMEIGHVNNLWFMIKSTSLILNPRDMIIVTNSSKKTVAWCWVLILCDWNNCEVKQSIGNQQALLNWKCKHLFTQCRNSSWLTCTQTINRLTLVITGIFHYPEKKKFRKKNPDPAILIPPSQSRPSIQSRPFLHPFIYSQLINPLVPRGQKIKIWKLADILMSRGKLLFLPFVACLVTLDFVNSCIFPVFLSTGK